MLWPHDLCRDWDTAVHEAGHVIIRLVYAVPFRRVSSVPVSSLGGDNLGGVEVEPGQLRCGPFACYGAIVDSVAGEIAVGLDHELDSWGEFLTVEQRQQFNEVERAIGRMVGDEEDGRPRIVLPAIFSPEFATRKDGRGSPDETPDDFTQAKTNALEFYASYGFTDPLSYFQQAERTAETILRDHWPQLNKLARSLYRRKSHTMTYRQVVRLLGDSMYQGGTGPGPSR